MRVTIIRDDGVVGVDGVFRRVDLSGLPAAIRAVQWDGSSGHIEYDAAENTGINSISSYQSFIDLWTAAAPPSPPPPGPPAVISMRQARLALYQSGYLSQVNTLIASADEESKITWDYSSEVRRSHPLVAVMAAQLPLTSQQLDDLFTLAVSL